MHFSCATLSGSPCHVDGRVLNNCIVAIYASITCEYGRAYIELDLLDICSVVLQSIDARELIKRGTVSNFDKKLDSIRENLENGLRPIPGAA